MIEPYYDRPETAGSLLVNASTLTSLAKSWSSKGYQVNIHAIGGSYFPFPFPHGPAHCNAYQKHFESAHKPQYLS